MLLTPKETYRIKSGEIALQLETGGKQTTIAHMKTAEIFGEMSVLSTFCLH
jgi:CRP-like cAMP-binding protein